MPAAVASRPDIAVDGQSIVRLDAVRVLVTDDEPDALALTVATLSAAGAEVCASSSVLQALVLMQRFKPHVLLSDLEMPGEDGYAFIAKVRGLPVQEGGLVPAIALSAYGRPDDRLRAIAAGFSMHVPKPVDPGELTAIVAGLATQPATLGEVVSRPSLSA